MTMVVNSESTPELDLMDKGRMGRLVLDMSKNGSGCMYLVADGRVRHRLHQGPGGIYKLLFQNAANNARIALRMKPDGMGKMFVADKDGRTQIEVGERPGATATPTSKNSTGRGRFAMLQTPDGAAALFIGEADGKERLVMLIMPDNSPTLSCFDASGKPRLVAGVSLDGSFALGPGRRRGRAAVLRPVIRQPLQGKAALNGLDSPFVREDGGDQRSGRHNLQDRGAYGLATTQRPSPRPDSNRP